MKILWRAIVEMFREGPGLLAERADRWVLREHGPYDVAGDGSGPMICRLLLCKKEWPCDQFIAADRRIDERINRRDRTDR